MDKVEQLCAELIDDWAAMGKGGAIVFNDRVNEYHKHRTEEDGKGFQSFIQGVPGVSMTVVLDLPCSLLEIEASKNLLTYVREAPMCFCEAALAADWVWSSDQHSLGPIEDLLH